jgi:hypothetical protein
MNGDRVNAEYYLQFADHYFRVMADTRLRQDEQRAQRDGRWQEGDTPQSDSDDSGEFTVDSDFPTFDQTPVYTRRDREDRGDNGNGGNGGNYAGNGRGSENRGNEPRSYEGRDREPRETRNQEGRGQETRNYQGNRPRRDDRYARDEAREPAVAAENSDAPTHADMTEVVSENPFIREEQAPRGNRGLRPRRDMGREGQRPVREPKPPFANEVAAVGLDPNILPPSISITRDEAPVVAGEAEAAPKPRRRAAPRRKAADDGADEAMGSLV